LGGQRSVPQAKTLSTQPACVSQVAEASSTGGSSRAPTWNSAAPTAWLEFLTVQTLILAGVCNVSAHRLRCAAPDLSGLDNRVLRSGTTASAPSSR
jgi:hypothetical protein